MSKMNKHLTKGKESNIQLELPNSEVKNIEVKSDVFIMSDGSEIKTGKMFMENEIILN